MENVVSPPKDKHLTRVDLICLDDDNQGKALSVLWELELGAKILEPETQGLGKLQEFDPPRYFAAYIKALTCIVHENTG